MGMRISGLGQTSCCGHGLPPLLRIAAHGCLIRGGGGYTRQEKPHGLRRCRRRQEGEYQFVCVGMGGLRWTCACWYHGCVGPHLSMVSARACCGRRVTCWVSGSRRRWSGRRCLARWKSTDGRGSTSGATLIGQLYALFFPVVSNKLNIDRI